MLDHFTILTQSGLVLWSKSFTPTPSPLDSLIREALIEERSSSSSSSAGISSWAKDGYALQWSLANNLDLVFVLAYQRILQLTYTDELLLTAKRVFVGSYEDTIRAIVDSSRGKDVPLAARGLGGSEGWTSLFEGWEETFSRMLRELELGAKSKKLPRAKVIQAEAEAESEEDTEATTASADDDGATLDSQAIAKNIAALRARQKTPVKKGKKPAADSSPATSDAPDTPASSKKKGTPKAGTKWADSKLSAADVASYDFSDAPPSSGTATPTKGLVSDAALGKRSKSGLYEVADYAARAEEEDDDAEQASSGTSGLSSFLSRLSLSPKALTEKDLAPALELMRQHLMAKNVAADIATKVCDGVGKSLVGVKASGFGSVRREVRAAMEKSLTKILTPASSTDLLQAITQKRAQANTAQTKAGKSANPPPYAITFVGVNGVGKSTNLSKVAFWLLQNRLRVLIAACDTFRSGAVEQLRVHVRNLGALGEQLAGETGRVELFERGYGKDAAGIAKDALAYGREQGFDVVLIDTAGRMQDNEPLMRALAKLVAVNQPDKIVFVGEALVGNEAVDQLTKFDRSLRDFSGAAGGPTGSSARGIDGMILTKFDTIDDKVGAALSMTYVTGQPIFFVGTGQTYSDLRSLRVAHIVGALMQD